MRHIPQVKMDAVHTAHTGFNFTREGIMILIGRDEDLLRIRREKMLAGQQKKSVSTQSARENHLVAAADSWALLSYIDAFGAPKIGGIMYWRVKKAPVGFYERDLADGNYGTLSLRSSGPPAAISAVAAERSPEETKLLESITLYKAMFPPFPHDEFQPVPRASYYRPHLYD
ncbi:hypothetical protein K438DRAFT_1777359 [Mycena galopus ATCC 62051]|nr:hypothetical protein K438DRAFT_1777359 [Mycena galopus ATCC 62051]